jgi:hypothetical protein
MVGLCASARRKGASLAVQSPSFGYLQRYLVHGWFPLLCLVSYCMHLTLNKNSDPVSGFGWTTYPSVSGLRT